MRCPETETEAKEEINNKQTICTYGRRRKSIRRAKRRQIIAHELAAKSSKENLITNNRVYRIRVERIEGGCLKGFHCLG